MLMVKVNIINNCIYQQGYKVLHRKESPTDKTNTEIKQQKPRYDLLLFNS